MNMPTSKGFLAIALFFGIAGLFFLQIYTAETITKTESSLFNILQLVFSIGFSWIISSHFSEKSFNDSQKKFAIGCFRRIKEIERSITRAQKLLNRKNNSQLQNSTEQQPVMICLMSAQDAVNSSIADWGDIIGDEIHLTKEIHKLKKLRSNADDIEKEYISNLDKSNESEDVNEKLNLLKADLPQSLRLEEEVDDEELLSEYFYDEMKDNGEIRFFAYWDADDSFRANFDETSVGDVLYISRGYTESRGNIILIHNKNGEWLGVILNKSMEYSPHIDIDYDRFAELFEEYIGYQLIPEAFGGKPLPVTVIEKLNTEDSSSQHIIVSLKADDISS